jgi:hypothetical protein
MTKMKIKSLLLLAITAFVIPSAMATCNEPMNTTELTSCVFLESKGVNYSDWKANFTNPPEIKKTRDNRDIAFTIDASSLRN